jgi:hypothetical protein
LDFQKQEPIHHEQEVTWTHFFPQLEQQVSFPVEPVAVHIYIYIYIYYNMTLQNPTNTCFISLANNKLNSVIILMSLSKLNSSAYSENCHNIWRHYWSHEDHHHHEYPANFCASKNTNPKVKHYCPLQPTSQQNLQC